MGKLVPILKTKIPIPGKKNPGAWIFFGWVGTISIAIFVLGYTAFFINSTVYQTLKNVDVIFSLKEKIIYNEININLFERVMKKWEAKKNLKKPDAVVDPFF